MRTAWYRPEAVSGTAAHAGIPAARLTERRTRSLRTVLAGAVLATAILAGELASPMLGEPGSFLPSATSASAAIPAQEGPCVDGWQELPIPDGSFLSTPMDVVTHDGKPAWVLGGSSNGLLALRWNGSGWRLAATGPSGHKGLAGGDPIGAKKVFTVGYKRPVVSNGDGSLQPISGRIIGTKWDESAVPDPPGPRASLTDVIALDGGDAWAVGTRLDGGDLRAYAARWSGKRWARNDPPGGSGSGLVAIEQAPSGSIWAVGWKETSRGRPRPYIVRRKNGKWQSVKAAAMPAGSAALTDVDFRTGRDGWAVGYLVPKGSDHYTPILQHWNGKKWSRVDLPWAAEAAALPRSVSAASNGELWIAGSQPANEKREARGFIARLRNGVWDLDVLGVPTDIRSEVMDVAATEWGAVAGASVGGSLLVLRSCDQGISAAKAARGKSRIKISHMKKRREAAEDPAHARTRNSEASVGFSLAGGEGVTLAAPVKPKGFVIQDVAAAAGLAQWTKTFDGFAADFDGNGYRDIFYSRHGSVAPRLAMNNAGSFADAPTTAFSPVDRHGCDRGDVDADGRKDILCSVGKSRGKVINRHELSAAPHTAEGYLVVGTAGISDPLGRGRAVTFLKLDGDPFPEVFISNAPDREDGLPGYNRFYRNIGGTFVPAPGAGLDTSHGAECVEASDVDEDGDDDLVYCTKYGFGGRRAGLRFMRNDNGKLKDRTAARGISQIGDIDVAFADVSGDGRKDLIQLNSSKIRVSKWTNKGYKKIYAAKVPEAWALAAGDVSGDGRADIYIVRGNDKSNMKDRLLVSKNGGRDFESVTIPQTKKGSADDVIALDYDLNGLTDFVVLNGRRKAGPVQLLAAFPN